MASESKQSVESQTGNSTNRHDGGERPSNNSKSPTGQTERTSSIGKREQAISRELSGHRNQWTRQMWTNNSSSKPPTGQTERTVVASESKQSEESGAADLDEQATAASSYQQDSQTKRTLSIGKREQAISRELGGQQHAPIDTTDVKKQQQRATGQPDGEDSGRKREQAISRERGGGCGRTSNSSKQLSTGQPDEEDIKHWQARASDQ